MTMSFVAPAYAGRNANGALIVHTNDAYSYSAATACTTPYAEPASCAAAITRSDKSSGTVVWLLAAFPDTSNPAVSVIYFGIDYDDVNLDPGSSYKSCGPAGTVEVPDGGWPYTGRGNSVALGSPVTGDLLFPFYVFRIDGGTEGSYFSTAANPTGGYAAFVDDSNPPVMDTVTRSGTIRWFAAGSNSCPASGGADGGGGGPDNPDGGGTDGGGGVDQWLDGDGTIHWARDCILVRLRDNLPMPPREPVNSLGIPAFDELSRELGVVSVRRVSMLSDEVCSNFRLGSHLAKLLFEPGTDEQAVARQFGQLSEVVWAEPDYESPAELLTEHIDLQWYLGIGSPQSCLSIEHPEIPAPDSCCAGCDIGIEQAWQYARGDSSVIVAVMDNGADMQHPDLFDVYARNPDLREDTNHNRTVELCPTNPDSGAGDINHSDDDGNGYADDVLLGWKMLPALGGWRPGWKHSAQTHGTAVAGLLAAITNDTLGVASVAGGNASLDLAGIRLIQFSFDEPNNIESGWTSSFDYARAYGARVYSSSVCNAILGNAIRDAVADHADSIFFVQAAGNDATIPICDFGRLPGVMAVGGYDCIGGGRWIVPANVANDEGSNYGPELSVMGPTDDSWNTQAYERMVLASTNYTHTMVQDYVCTPNWPDAIQCFGGTSAAAPIVASIAALIFSYSDEHHLDLSPAQVRTIIERTAEDIQCDPDEPGCECSSPDSSCLVKLLGWDQYTGYGRVDAGRAFTLPVAALEPLHPYGTYMVPGETALLKWEAIDLVPENGDLTQTPAHFELHFLVPEDPRGWQAIADSVATSESQFIWTVPDTMPLGENRYVRLTVMDSERHVNQDYRRFSVQDTANVAGVPGEPFVSIQGVAPNPTSKGARVMYFLGKPVEVGIRVFDVAGRRIRTLAHGKQAAGSWSLIWDGKDDSGRHVACGIYFVRLDLGPHARTVRLVMVR